MRSLIPGAEALDDLGEVLVAASGEGQDVVVRRPRHPRTRSGGGGGSCVLEKPGDRVRRLERRDDPLEAGKLAKRGERLVVGDRLVTDPADVAQVGMLGPDARI